MGEARIIPLVDWKAGRADASRVVFAVNAASAGDNSGKTRVWLFAIHAHNRFLVVARGDGVDIMRVTVDLDGTVPLAPIGEFMKEALR